jgi:hypothetical protein
MKMVKIHGKPTDPVEIIRYHPGMLIPFEQDGIPWFEFFEVPDPDHQSSLDYFEGI